MQQLSLSSAKGNRVPRIASLVPTFLRDSPVENERTKAPEPEDRRDTAHLDGLRGIAAFIVYILHFCMPFDRTSVLGFGPGLSYAVYNLPIIRVVRSGKAMVRIFFILSGYVLTLSPARHYNKASGEHHRRLGRAIMKRPLRLFVPPIATTFIAMLLLRLGVFQTAEEMEALPAHLPAQTMIFQPKLALQLLDWSQFIAQKLTNPWAWVEDLFVDPDASYYGAHLWTIQTEFRCSVIILSVLQGLLTLRIRALQYAVCGFLTLFCIAWSRWDVALFLAGMTMSLFDAEHAARAVNSDEIGNSVHSSMEFLGRPLSKVNSLRFAWKLAPLILLAFGLWSISYPDEKANLALGFGLASRLCASVDFWQSIGALAVIWATGRLCLLKRLLASKWLQYLGALSYSLYLVHYPLLETVGWRLTQLLREYFSTAAVQAGAAPALGVFAGNLFAFFTVTFALLWISDYTWRALDKPCLRMLRWLEAVL